MYVLDMHLADFRLNPHPFLAAAREAGPLCRLEPFGFIGITRYADVLAVLKNPQMFSSAGMEDAFPKLEGAELFTRNTTLIGNDPPDHARVRRLIQRAFTIREMAAWEPRVAAMTGTLIAALRDKGAKFDLIADLAMPLPVTVISEMLGVDAERQHDFKRWSDDMVAVRSALHEPDPVRRERRKAEIVKSCEEFTAYFDEVIATRRRKRDGDDLISAMVRASEDDQIIRADEVLSLTRLMLVAGNETTTNLLGNAMTALLKHRDQWELLRHRPELAAAATEEALRFDGPVLNLVRRVVKDTEIGGMALQAGTIIAPMLASANRDPRQFTDPDRFDIQRDTKDQIAFGSGVHLCVGAPLARMETRMVLGALALEPGELSLSDEDPVWLDSMILRGHKRLTLRRSLNAPLRRERPEAGAQLL
jgi:cytochrome P450